MAETAPMRMPEAAVDEDYLSESWEDEVWLPRKTFNVKAISEAKPMQLLTHEHFWSCIFRPDAAHVFTSANDDFLLA